MGQLLIQSLGCPNCGAPYEPSTRHCRFCGSVLIVTSISDAFGGHLDTHQVSASVSKWRKRIKEDADSAEAHFALGLSYLNSKLRDAALAHFRKAVLLAPEIADGHHNLAVTLFNDGNITLASPDYAEAMKEIDYSIRLAPNFREAVAFKHFFLARKLDAVDNTQALAEYQKAVEACPDIAILQNNLGLCYSNSANYAEARVRFKRAIKLDPNCALAYSNLCMVMYQQGHYVTGIDLGIKAVSLMGPATLEGSQAVAHNNLALCLWKSKRKQEALEHMNKAIALNPANALFQQNLQTINSSCFIATATMGGSAHPYVVELAAFRDQRLVKIALGRCVIGLYERLGPVLARIIASSRILRRISFLLVVVPAVSLVRLVSLNRKAEKVSDSP